MVQSCPEASPVKWHQAHTTWFFETFVLRPFLPDYKPFRDEFGWLFNSYYNSLGEEAPEKHLRASFSRPSLDQVLAFRTHAANGSSIHGNLLDTGRLHPAIASGDGLDQLFGDSWEWTASPYTGYPGYKPFLVPWANTTASLCQAR